MTFEIAALVGITLIVVRGTIFTSLQKLWPEFFRCSQCVGMWVGLAAGGAGLASAGYGPIIDTVLAGGATSASALLADAVLFRLLGGDPE